jgi:DNA-binding transcriptional regulator/RsmH inhibitor MraZ
MVVFGKVHEGHHDYKMDSKYRVSIPVAYRPGEGEPVRIQSSKEHGAKVIKVFPEPVFEDKFRQLRESELTPERKSQLAGALRMSCRVSSVSSQGKLALPKDWAEEIGLKAEGPVKVAGRDSYFIICTRETFDRILEGDQTMDDAGLGIL